MSPPPLHIRSHAHGILEHNGTPLHSPPAGPTSPAAPLLNAYSAKEHDRPSQLAQLLSASYAESEGLRHQLRLTQRALERNERMIASLSSPSNEAHHKALVEEQARADHAERERDAALEKIRAMHDAWQDVVRYMSGPLGEGSSSQTHRSILQSSRFMDVSPSLAPRALNGTHGAFARVTLPTPPQVHRRPRELSPDGAYTNGASPAKRPRGDLAMVQPPVWNTETTSRGRHPTLPSSFDIPVEQPHTRHITQPAVENGPPSVATRPRRNRRRSASRASSSSSMSLDKMLLEATTTGEELRGPNALAAQQYQSPSALASMAISGPGVPRPLGGPGQTPSYASLGAQSQAASGTTYVPSAPSSVSGQSVYGNGIHHMSLGVNGHERLPLPHQLIDQPSSRHQSPGLAAARRPSPLETRELKVEAQPPPFPIVGPAPQEPMMVSPPSHHAYVPPPPAAASLGGGFKSRGLSRSRAAVPGPVTGPGLAGSLPPPPVLGNANNNLPPLAQPQPQREYTTHIFTPPVTGAPVKRNKSLLYGSSLPSIPGNPSSPAPSTTSHVSGAPTLIPPAPSPQPTTAPPSVSGRDTNTGLGPGGFPATNSAGQRICRQCGHPGRYKDGKCVEKWGPGPEGPGTVCDRCRKKMKRVERRGTEPAGLLGAGGASAAGSASGSRAASPHRPAGNGAGKSHLGRPEAGNPYPDARRDSRSPDTRASGEDGQPEDGENDIDIEGDLDAPGSPDSAIDTRRVSPAAPSAYGTGLDRERDRMSLHAPSARTSRRPSPVRPPIAVLRPNGQAGVDVEMEDYRDVSPTRLLEAAIDGDVPPPSSAPVVHAEIEDDLLEAVDAAERRSHGGRRSMGEDDD